MAESTDYTRQAMSDHRKTYAGFLSVTKVAMVFIAFLLIAMALFLT